MSYSLQLIHLSLRNLLENASNKYTNCQSNSKFIKRTSHSFSFMVWRLRNQDQTTDKIYTCLFYHAENSLFIHAKSTKGKKILDETLLSQQSTTRGFNVIPHWMLKATFQDILGTMFWNILRQEMKVPFSLLNIRETVMCWALYQV